MFNADETHFVIAQKDGPTLAMKVYEDVSFAYVVSGDDGLIMMLMLGGGCYASIQSPVLISKNSSRSYPIQGCHDNLPGVSNRSQPRGWMDGLIFL